MDLSFIAICAGIVLTFIVILYRTRHHADHESYLLANRNVGVFALSATLIMTELNPATLVAFSGMGYIAGWWALTLPMVFLIGLLFYSITVAKKWKSFNGLCVTEFLASRYGRGMGHISRIALFLAMAGFSATYVKSLALILSPLSTLSLPLLATGITSLSFLLVYRGGLLAIIKMDVISLLFVSFIFMTVLLVSWQHSGFDNLSAWVNQFPLETSKTLLPSQFVLSLIVLTMFTYILAPWYGQKMFSAKNTKTAYVSAAIAAIFVFAFYGIALIATSFLKGKVNLDNPEFGFAYILYHWLPLPLKAIALFTFFLIGATTLAGVWNAMTTLLVSMQGTQKKSLKKPKAYMALSAGLSFLLAMTLVDNILNKLILANIPIAALSFSLIAGFYWTRATTIGAYLSFIVGITWGIGCFVYFGEQGLYTWYWAMYGIPLIFITGWLGSILSPFILFNKRTTYETIS